MPKLEQTPPTNLQFLGAEPLPEVKTEVDEGKQQGSADDNAAERAEIEKEAAYQGWVPKDDFKGKPEDWVDADAFVKRGREINPILRKNNERLQKDLAKRDARIAELELTQKEFGDMYKTMSDNAYKRAKDELKAQIRQARKDDDHDTVDDLTEQLEALDDESKKIKVPGAGRAPADDTTVQAERKAIVDAWAAENPWYNPETNPAAYYAAEGIALAFAKTAEGKALVGKREFLDAVTERVKTALPDAFKNKRRQTGSPVSGTGSTQSGAGGSNGKKTYADLPADVKATCDRQVKAIPGFTREKYVQYYEESGGFNA